MNPERKIEVNRRLAEFDAKPPKGSRLVGEEALLYPPDYTADLNALVRLETKLPPHNWVSRTAGQWVIWEMWGMNNNPLSCNTDEATTEAEARAEAICRFLEPKETTRGVALG